MIIISGFTACKTTITSSEEISKDESLSSDSIYRFTISFYSKGGGTDRLARGEFEIYLENFNKKNHKKLHYETTNWGREGEVDYCFKLEELRKKEQQKFIDDCKELLKESELVRFEEFSTCRSNKVKP